MIFVVAGRRPDAPDAPAPRFPETMCPRVQSRLHALYQQMKPKEHVSSAAAGTDLLALEAAKTYGARPLVIIPYDIQQFVEIAIRDKGEHWVRRFNLLMPWIKTEGELQNLRLSPWDNGAFAATNLALLKRAQDLSPEPEVLAVLVWDGRSSGGYDHSLNFKNGAEANSYRIREISTLP